MATGKSDFDRLMEAFGGLIGAVQAIATELKNSSGGGGRWDEIIAKLDSILIKEDEMAGELAKLTEEVTEIKGKSDSLIALVQGLGDIIRDNVGNGPALLALAADLDAQSGKIQAAVDANPLPGEGGGGGGGATALSGGTVGVSYSAFIGTGSPETYAVTGGSLPDGCSMDSAGNFSGTPGTAGTFAFSVTATAPDGTTTSKDYTITII